MVKVGLECSCLSYPHHPLCWGARAHPHALCVSLSFSPVHGSCSTRMQQGETGPDRSARGLGMLNLPGLQRRPTIIQCRQLTGHRLPRDRAGHMLFYVLESAFKFLN